MLTIAKIIITCATCPETLDLHYSHESLAARTLVDDIKHDATISSDWHFRDGLFYCDSCGEAMENTRDEQAKLAQVEEATKWGADIPYASAIRDNLNGK